MRNYENLCILLAVLAEQETFQWVVIGSILCGYIRAMSVVNQNLTVSEYCHESKLPAALGLNMVTKGLVVLSVGQFLGRYFTLNSAQLSRPHYACTDQHRTDL